MILSFGWTAELLPPNGCKDTTRRKWSERTLKTWQKQYEAYPDKLHKAYSKSPAYGGEQIGWIVLKERPFLERLLDMPEEECAREGHPELSKGRFIDKYFWHPKKSWDNAQTEKNLNELLFSEFVVIRFEFFPGKER